MAGDEVGVAVAQLLEHIAADVEQLAVGHLVGHAGTVALVHLVPVHLLVVKEAVVLVHDGPQGFEVAHLVALEVVPLGTPPTTQNY